MSRVSPPLAATARCAPRRAASRRAFVVAAVLWLAAAAVPARAQNVELASLELARTDEGLVLGYVTRFELPRAVEEAMQKGVPLYFVAEATLRRPRWYWADKVVTRHQRQWRLTWQPLTRRYRLNLGSVGQNYDGLEDALAALQRSARWKLAEPADLADGGRQYLDFSFKLDTSQLPRPLQISFGGEADWTLAVERRIAVPEAPAAPSAPAAAGAAPPLAAVSAPR